MRTNINTYSRAFCADKKTKDPTTGQYTDPLMHWPLRGAAFTNEVGEALRPVIGDYATLTWAPALLYIGADVYDKYKNDKTEYSPDSKRCLQQACFQGLASVLLPVVAVKGGQNLFSLFGMSTKDKITFNAKEQIISLAKKFVADGNMRAYRDNDNDCTQKFLDIVDNHFNSNKSKKIATRPLMHNVFKKFKVNTKENLDKFAIETITNLIQSRKSLLNPSDTFINEKLYSNYEVALKNGQTKNVAVKSALISNLNKKTLKGKAIKTLGGFIALGLAINPIDKFVEHVLIEKVIGPRLSK